MKITFKKITLSLMILVYLFILLPKVHIQSYYKNYLFDDLNTVPSKPVALVLGAAIWGKDRPSHVLEDRITTAVDLYKANKISKIIMSGDNAAVNYNEPQTMKNVAVDLGVPEEDIILDHAGFRTYDSCYRLKAIFQQEQAIIVTQKFHLPRAVYTCNVLGINAIGYQADKRQLLARNYNTIREFAAQWVAFWQVNILKPKPKFLGPIEKVF